MEPKIALRDLRVGIVGLGLMGGSLALALRGQVAQIVGIERDALTRQLAEREAVVDATFETLSADVPPLDLLVLATPVRAILAVISELAQTRPDGCLLFDLGSTKQAVVTAMSALPSSFAAIGGHPMCGKETAGLSAATTDLYQGQVFIMCPTLRTTPVLESLVLRVIGEIGARPVFLDAAEHDAIVARVSHLPYAIAAMLMRLAAEERLWAVSASGFRDTSRLAGTDPRMMLDIVLTNSAEILAALNDFERELHTFKELVAGGNEPGLGEWLAAALVRYAAYRRYRSAEPPTDSL